MRKLIDMNRSLTQNLCRTIVSAEVKSGRAKYQEKGENVGYVMSILCLWGQRQFAQQNEVLIMGFYLSF